MLDCITDTQVPQRTKQQPNLSYRLVQSSFQHVLLHPCETITKPHMPNEWKKLNVHHSQTQKISTEKPKVHFHPMAHHVQLPFSYACSHTVQYNHYNLSLSAQTTYALSPRIRRANCISFGIIVTRFACIAHKFVSSNNETKYASAASCSAPMAVD